MCVCVCAGAAFGLCAPRRKSGILSIGKRISRYMGEMIYQNLVAAGWQDLILKMGDEELALMGESVHDVRYFYYYPANSDKLRGITLHFIMCDEAAFMSTKLFFTIVMPLFEVDDTALVCISSPGRAFGFYSTLINMTDPYTGATMLPSYEVELICDRCAENGRDRCPHQSKYYPKWKSSAKQAMIRKMMPMEDLQREIYGKEVNADETRVVSDEVVDVLDANPLFHYDVSLPAMNVLTTWDPNAGGPNHSTLVSTVWHAGQLIVRHTPLYFSVFPRPLFGSSLLAVRVAPRLPVVAARREALLVLQHERRHRRQIGRGAGVHEHLHRRHAPGAQVLARHRQLLGEKVPQRAVVVVRVRRRRRARVGLRRRHEPPHVRRTRVHHQQPGGGAQRRRAPRKHLSVHRQRARVAAQAVLPVRRVELVEPVPQLRGHLLDLRPQKLERLAKLEVPLPLRMRRQQQPVDVVALPPHDLDLPHLLGKLRRALPPRRLLLLHDARRLHAVRTLHRVGRGPRGRWQRRRCPCLLLLHIVQKPPMLVHVHLHRHGALPVLTACHRPSYVQIVGMDSHPTRSGETADFVRDHMLALQAHPWLRYANLLFMGESNLGGVGLVFGYMQDIERFVPLKSEAGHDWGLRTTAQNKRVMAHEGARKLREQAVFFCEQMVVSNRFARQRHPQWSDDQHRREIRRQFSDELRRLRYFQRVPQNAHSQPSLGVSGKLDEEGRPRDGFNDDMAVAFCMNAFVWPLLHARKLPGLNYAALFARRAQGTRL